MTGQVSEARVGQRVLLAKLIGLDLTGAKALWKDLSRKELWAGVGTGWEGAGAWMWGMESGSGNSEAEPEAWPQTGIRCRGILRRSCGALGKPHDPTKPQFPHW